MLYNENMDTDEKNKAFLFTLKKKKNFLLKYNQHPERIR